MNFNEYLEQDIEISEELRIQTLLYLCDNLDILNESPEDIYEGLAKSLQSFGLKLHKSKGILDYIKSFATGVGKLFLYLIKGDSKKAKELVLSMKREDILDFLYKLDLGTLHLFTGPLHMIDAWTGWDIAVIMSDKMSKGGELLQKLAKSILSVKSNIRILFNGQSKREKRMITYINNLEKELNVG